MRQITSDVRPFCDTLRCPYVINTHLENATVSWSSHSPQVERLARKSANFMQNWKASYGNATVGS
jgi:hypothetical protein